MDHAAADPVALARRWRPTLAVQLRGGHSAPPTHWAGPGDEDMLGDFGTTGNSMRVAASQVVPLDSSPPRAPPDGFMRGRASRGRLLLRWRLAARTKAGHLAVRLETSLRADIRRSGVQDGPNGDQPQGDEDMAGLESRMVQMETSLRADMTRMETGLRTDMTKMESGLREDIGNLRSSLNWQMLVVGLTIIGLTVTLIKLIP